MSLGSLPRWQSALFGAIQFANTAYFETNIPICVVITTLISSILFFRFEYTDGSVISALAVLETPTLINTEPSQKIGFPETGKLENGPAGRNDTVPREGPEDTRQFLWNLRQKFIRNAVPFLGGSLLSLAAIYFLSLYGFIDMDINDITYNMPGPVLYWTIAGIALIFSASPDSNAVTNDRSLARRQLQSQKGFLSPYPGLDVFLVYMLLAFVAMTMTRPIFATEEPRISLFILSRLFSGLLLTNLHTAWVHTVISKPNNKDIWQRIPGWREWIGVLPAASLDLTLPTCVHYLTKTLMLFLREICTAAMNHWFDEEIPSALERLGGMIFYIMPYASELFVSTMTRAIYIRVAVSMLPDNDEPIVTFDRSFGGRARNDGRYCLSIFDAVRTMRFLNWYRYAKIVWEVFWYEEMWALFFCIAVAVEFYFWAPHSVIDLLALLLPDAS
ncbi:hypothetical protein N7467_001498 [Penicillium canescens]|nr:hypothetical protein N7467_001498 [Penicillium canescens]